MTLVARALATALLLVAVAARADTAASLALRRSAASTQRQLELGIVGGVVWYDDGETTQGLRLPLAAELGLTDWLELQLGAELYRLDDEQTLAAGVASPGSKAESVQSTATPSSAAAGVLVALLRGGRGGLSLQLTAEFPANLDRSFTPSSDVPFVLGSTGPAITPGSIVTARMRAALLAEPLLVEASLGARQSRYSFTRDAYTTTLVEVRNTFTDAVGSLSARALLGAVAVGMNAEILETDRRTVLAAGPVVELLGAAPLTVEIGVPIYLADGSGLGFNVSVRVDAELLGED